LGAFDFSRYGEAFRNKAAAASEALGKVGANRTVIDGFGMTVPEMAGY